MKRSVFILILSFTLLCGKMPAQRGFRVMFYNVENLFDTKDNPLKNDDAFTPRGNQRWYNSRYWKKLHDVSKVITSIGEGYPPALVGLCEVENDSVLYDLTKRASLNRHKYSYVITDSKDDRGMNVALLYQRDEMKVLGKRAYTPVFEEDKNKKTRDILHVVGKVVSGDTLDIFVCHFQSRVEGIKKTRPYRIQIAKLLKQKTDSLFRVRKKANIIVMGDFNDYPNDESLSVTLGAGSIKGNVAPKKLYNLFYHRVGEKDVGTYRYRGKWNYLDQFIVSGSLLGKSRTINIKENTAHIYTSGFLMEKDNKYGGEKPFRTYSGFKYLGGVSDHLPIYLDLIIK